MRSVAAMGRTKRRKKLKANCRLISMNMRELWNVSQMAHISLYWQYDIDKMNMLYIASNEKKVCGREWGREGRMKSDILKELKIHFSHTCDISEMYIQHKKGTHISHWIMLSIYYIFSLCFARLLVPPACVLLRKRKNAFQYRCIFVCLPNRFRPPKK